MTNETYMDHEYDQAGAEFIVRFKNAQGEEVSRIFREISPADFEALKLLAGADLLQADILKNKRHNDIKLIAIRN